jgi:hypothetical protein
MDLLSRGSVQTYFYLFEGLGINSRFGARQCGRGSRARRHVQRGGGPGSWGAAGAAQAPAPRSDRYNLRFIVSPEAGKRLDLTEFARELVREMQTDLGRAGARLRAPNPDPDPDRDPAAARAAG